MERDAYLLFIMVLLLYNISLLYLLQIISRDVMTDRTSKKSCGSTSLVEEYVKSSGYLYFANMYINSTIYTVVKEHIFYRPVLSKHDYVFLFEVQRELQTITLQILNHG